MHAAARTLLDRHVDRFNAGVRSGDFGPMLERFATESVLEFEGVPVGPFAGRAAIAAAYATTPPDNEIVILAAAEPAADLIVADYAWCRTPDRRAGELRLTHAEGLITRLVVTFD